MWETKVEKPLYTIEPECEFNIKITKCENGFILKYYERIDPAEEEGTLYRERTLICENILDLNTEGDLKDKLKGYQIGLHKIFQLIREVYLVDYKLLLDEEEFEAPGFYDDVKGN